MGETAPQEIAIHLAGCPACHQHVERRALEVEFTRRLWNDRCNTVLVGEQRNECTEIPEHHTPEWIGRYSIRGLLGRGGQAIVYRGKHPVLDLEVAIKCWKSSGRSAGRIQQLLSEGRRLARMSHPHVIRVLDADLADGVAFLVLELIRGPSLASPQIRLTLPQKARIAASVASAVAALHEAEILHLDLKPENVLLDETGQPRLIDLGIAREIGSEADDDALSGGTPEYLAPETCVLRKVDQRTDVYGLGAILHDLLTGHVGASAPHESGLLCPLYSDLLDISRRAMEPRPERRMCSAREFERLVRQALRTAGRSHFVRDMFRAAMVLSTSIL